MIRTREERLELFQENQRIAMSVSRQIHRRLPPCITFDEIHNAGLLGVWVATGRWDETQAKFSTFAWQCSRSAVLDYLRRLRGRSVPTVQMDGDERLIPDQPQMLVEVDWRNDLLRMLAPLKPRHRDICLSVWVDEESAATVAERYRLSRSSVTNCLTEARKTLRSVLREFAPVHQTHGGGNSHVGSESKTGGVFAVLPVKRSGGPRGDCGHRAEQRETDDRRSA